MEIVEAATRAGRVIYASNHKSHTDYLVEPLVLDDNGVRPPIIAAGINLFGGPLGLIHKHVTGAIPIRRNTKDPGVSRDAEGVRGRAAAEATTCCSIRRAGAATAASSSRPKTGLIARGAASPSFRACHHSHGDFLRPRPRGSHPGAPAGQAQPAAVHARAGRDVPVCRRLSFARVRHLRPAHSAGRLGSAIAARRDGARQADAPVDRQAREGAADLRDGRRDAAVDHAEGSGSARRCA